MAQTKVLLSGATAVGGGSGVEFAPDLARRAMVASVSGVGAVSATVEVDVSNDGIVWATRATLTLSGTNTAVEADVDAISPFPWVRGNITALSGTSAVLTLSVCAS